MTRKEQIYRAGQDYSKQPEHFNGKSIIEVAELSKNFRAGAEWADSHPNWHKPDEKPSATHCLVCLGYDWIGQDQYAILHYSHEKEAFYETIWDSELSNYVEDYYDNKDIIAWMELPEFN